ncbi:hypothetical protein CGCF413_v001291 [Colletotrichum fructicola]|nr:hypothetical protein CGCF413_v001291 [Colletotrichum fructicola]
MFSGPVSNGPEARPEWKVLEWNRRDCVRDNWGSLAGHFVLDIDTVLASIVRVRTKVDIEKRHPMTSVRDTGIDETTIISL